MEVDSEEGTGNPTKTDDNNANAANRSTPTERNDNVYARGAVDDKGQLWMQVKADVTGRPVRVPLLEQPHLLVDVVAASSVRRGEQDQCRGIVERGDRLLGQPLAGGKLIAIAEDRPQCRRDWPQSGMPADQVTAEMTTELMNIMGMSGRQSAQEVKRIRDMVGKEPGES